MVLASDEGLAGAGDAEQRLVAEALGEAVGQALDRRRLVAGKLQTNSYGYQDRNPATVIVLTQTPGTDALKAARGIKAKIAGAVGALPARASNTASSTIPPSSSRSPRASSTRRSSRRSASSCSSCCCSCRPGARRSFRSSPSRSR